MIMQLVVALLLLSIWIRERGYPRPVTTNAVAGNARGLAALRRIKPLPSVEGLAARIAESLGVPRSDVKVASAKETGVADLRSLTCACLELGIGKPPDTVDALLRAIAAKLGISRVRSRDELLLALAKTFEEIDTNRRTILELCGLMRVDGTKSGRDLGGAVAAAVDLNVPEAAELAELTPILLRHFGLPPSGIMRRDLFTLAERLRLPTPYWIADFGADSADLVQFYRDVANGLGIATIKNPIALLEDCAAAAGILAKEPGSAGLSYRELRSIIASHFGRAGATLGSTLEAFVASARYASGHQPSGS